MSLITTGVTLGESTGKLIVLNLSGYRKARIWLGALPELNYPVVKVLSRTKDAKKDDISEVRRTAVEMFIPTGGRFIYGLLEAEFTPTNLGEFSIKVATSANTGNPVDWSLAASVDEVCAGIPLEYSESIIEGALSAGGDILGSGILCFEGGAHGALSSSNRIFRHLATTAVRILACPFESVSEENLTALVASF
ncbi:hypothetical protein BCD67_06160 [Oscillatoriales cyanobacterium USR001]|nr:hypothetical protein BCD67_06160 [Oscillatoriales cyanobacterium USR001]